MNRGGKRPGAGRKSTDGARVSITFRLPVDALAILEQKAQEQGVSRTSVLTALLRETK